MSWYLSLLRNLNINELYAGEFSRTSRGPGSVMSAAWLSLLLTQVGRLLGVFWGFDYGGLLWQWTLLCSFTWCYTCVIAKSCKVCAYLFGPELLARSELSSSPAVWRLPVNNTWCSLSCFHRVPRTVAASTACLCHTLPATATPISSRIKHKSLWWRDQTLTTSVLTSVWLGYQFWK